MFSSVKKIPSTNSLSRYEVTTSSANETNHFHGALLLNYHKINESAYDSSSNGSSNHSPIPIHANYGQKPPYEGSNGHFNSLSSLGRSDSEGSFELTKRRSNKSLQVFDNISDLSNGRASSYTDLPQSSLNPADLGSTRSLNYTIGAHPVNGILKRGHAIASGTSSETNGHYRNNMQNCGLVGLHNLGNTCFMNCVLQCLSHTRVLLEYCLSEGYRSDIRNKSGDKGQLMKSFAKLLKVLWEENGESSVSPSSFRSRIQQTCPRFAGYAQQDAQEFLRYLIAGLHDDVNRCSLSKKPSFMNVRDASREEEDDSDVPEAQRAETFWKKYLKLENSKIVDVFVGQLKSTLTCTVCEHSSVTFDPFWDLSLPIPKSTGKPTLEDCLSLFTEEEFLDGHERPLCIKCKAKRRCSKRFSIHKFPKILVLHLKRFSSPERYRAKLSNIVTFPINELDMSEYGTQTFDPDTAPQPVYNLYGVVNHMGTASAGHYSAFCNHPYSKIWHEFDDSRVSKLSQFRLVSPEAYILFYELSHQCSKL